jgi:uncharacterized protein YtpQ (UPF0354 family)
MVDLKKELADPGLTLDKLSLLIAAFVREAHPDATLTSPAPNAVQAAATNGRDPSTFYLDNLWAEFRGQDPAARVDAFQRYLRGFLTALENPAKEQVCRDRIVPTIKDSEYFAIIKDTSALLREHLVGDLWILYAIDYPDTIKTLSASERDKLGIQQEELRTLAIENLRNVMPEIQQHGDGPWYLLTAGGDYVASILLLDSVWSQLENAVDGDIVAVVPSRDVLLFTGSRSKEGIEQIRARARAICESGGHLISETLIRRSSGRWSVFD